ncbi:hypothetical protein ACTWQB_14745 [Piscibacillus sp. B03]|uniref:hypothetical protein n=1 Tax=Piscibacillus sp. B03 TaxID=3457430 RepID=UPI003FCE3E7B
MKILNTISICFFSVFSIFWLVVWELQNAMITSLFAMVFILHDEVKCLKERLDGDNL